MKINCLSDTHSLHDKIPGLPDADVLVVAGDLTEDGTLDELASFSDCLRTFAHEHSIVIAGNHDICLALEHLREEGEALLESATYLRDESYEIDGVKFYGSPWTPKYGYKVFHKQAAEDLREVWDAIPDDTDVLITHGPPFGILDMTKRGIHAGCKELRDRVNAIRPALHIFGHIHEGFGEYEEHGTRFINASFKRSADENVNFPIMVEI